jgi:23S rRNA pseudouridine1911/1915/1917 synthase
MADDIVIEIGADPPARLDKALARDAPPEAALSRTRIARLIAEGAVSSEGRVLGDPSARVPEGARIAVRIGAPVEIDLRAEAIPLSVVHEDADLIVVDKPAGMVVHPAPGAPSGTLVNALMAHCGASLSGIGGEMRPGIVHRIDKDTSGLLVAAKSDRAHHGLAAQFAAHDVARRYLALIHGVPDESEPRLRGLAGVSFENGGVMRIATQIGRHRTDRQRQAVLSSGGRHAVTRAQVTVRLGAPPVAALATCWLETGRTHQIRVHMAHVGHPLIGDPVYGARRKLPAHAFGPEAVEAADGFPRQALHAATLGFFHPVTGTWLEFLAPLPDDMRCLLTRLGGDVGPDLDVATKRSHLM